MTLIYNRYMMRKYSFPGFHKTRLTFFNIIPGPGSGLNRGDLKKFHVQIQSVKP